MDDKKTYRIPVNNINLNEPDKLLSKKKQLLNGQHIKDYLKELLFGHNMISWIFKGNEVLHISLSYEKLWGQSCESFIHDPFSFMNSIHFDDIDEFKKVFFHMVEGGSLGFKKDFRVVHTGGEEKWISGDFRILEIIDGEPLIGGMLEDISKLKELEFENKRKENTIKLENKQVFDELSIEIDRRKRIENELRMKERKLARVNEKIILQNNKIILQNEELKAKLLEINNLYVKLKKSEQELQENNRKMGSLISNLSGIFYRCKFDKDFTMEFLNDGCFQLTGYRPNQLLNNKLKSYNDIIHPDDKEDVYNKIKQCIDKNKIYVLNYRIIKKNGEIRWVWEKGMAVYDDAGSVVCLEGIINDNTDFIQASNENKMLLNALKYSPVGTYIIDARGVIKYVNPKFCEESGYSADELLGKSPWIINPDGNPSGFFQAIEKTVRMGKSWQGELKRQKKNGDIYWVSSSVAAIADRNKEFINYVVVEENITSIKKAQEELTLAKLKAEESDQLKSAFLTNLSHEIRTPMNGIIGFTELIERGAVTMESSKHYFDIVKDSSKRLLVVINNLIDISKIETGQMDLNKKTFDLHMLLDELYHEFETELDHERKTDVQIVLEKYFDTNEQIIHSDREKIKQVLSILFHNSLKFTNIGFIKFGYKMNINNKLLLYVSDSGIGIHNLHNDEVFKQFTQEKNISRDYGGNGLGLSIAKGLISLMDGKIWYDSLKNTGTSFYVSMPLDNKDEGIETDDKPDSKNAYDWNDKTFLIAEDTELNVLYLEELLRPTGAQILHAENGQDAFDLCKDERRKIDLILMDLRMPVMDGIEASKQIRKINKTVPIIAQTAFSSSTDKKNCLDAGCNDYLSKPFSSSELYIKIDALLSGSLE